MPTPERAGDMSDHEYPAKATQLRADTHKSDFDDLIADVNKLRTDLHKRRTEIAKDRERYCN